MKAPWPGYAGCAPRRPGTTGPPKGAVLSHEGLLDPQADSEGYLLRIGHLDYRFRAARHALEHWVVDRSSLRVERAGTEARREEGEDAGPFGI